MDWLNIWLPEPIPLVCLSNILWIAQIYAGVYFHIILSCCIFIRNLSFVLATSSSLKNVIYPIWYYTID